MAMPIVVLISGSGTTLENLVDHIQAGELDAEVRGVVSSREDAYGLQRADNHGIPGAAVPRKQFDDIHAFNEALWAAIRKHDPELIVLAGFLSLLEVPPDFHNRILNIHPALIPAFSGQGMYGMRVHRAAIEYGVKVSGATVHIVDTEYDHGPIVLQEPVPVFDTDTPEALRERVQAKERELYPRAVQLFAKSRVRVEGRRVRIV